MVKIVNQLQKVRMSFILILTGVIEKKAKIYVLSRIFTPKSKKSWKDYVEKKKLVTSYVFPEGAHMDVNKHPDNKVQTHCPRCEMNDKTYYVPHDETDIPDPIYCFRCVFMFPDY